MKILGNLLIADGVGYPLNPYGYGEWTVLQTIDAPQIHRRYGCSVDLTPLIQNPNYSAVPVKWEDYPQYSSDGSLFLWNKVLGVGYIIAPKYTGHTPLAYTTGGKGVPR